MYGVSEIAVPYQAWPHNSPDGEREQLDEGGAARLGKTDGSLKWRDPAPPGARSGGRRKGGPVASRKCRMMAESPMAPTWDPRMIATREYSRHDDMACMAFALPVGEIADNF